MVPKNLEECYIALDNMIDAEGKARISKNPIGRVDVLSHHGFGTQLRNDWGLWEGGPLRDFFNENDVWHADDMSAIIFDGYVAYLRKEPFDLGGRAAYYRKWWADNYNGMDIRTETLKGRK